MSGRAASSSTPLRGVELSDEILTFLVQKAAEIHHGRLILEINVDSPSKIDILVEQKERFRTSEAVSAPKSVRNEDPTGRRRLG